MKIEKIHQRNNSNFYLRKVWKEKNLLIRKFVMLDVQLEIFFASLDPNGNTGGGSRGGSASNEQLWPAIEAGTAIADSPATQSDTNFGF